jgi:hypothetical protein
MCACLATRIGLNATGALRGRLGKRQQIERVAQAFIAGLSELERALRLNGE